ncbi:major facilitator superfamily domain-containing protein 9 [Elysia marginata]|uniref:Major facilitator superfamily domain-containing protein 9 n=1 Tax=Elysia marginata TaxID=1093978 RepID=A0AAV4I345_9GAST|nr:major facilitator superfamily domain-containing protein 9 [Elysia marginata]
MNPEQAKMQMNVIYFSGFLDLFAVSMIMPLILPQAIELGASPTLAGVLGSVYGGLQLVSSPIIRNRVAPGAAPLMPQQISAFQACSWVPILQGKWSDGVSRRFSLLLCMVFTGFGYTVLGLCSSVFAFFISRFILGCFKHSQTISRAFLSDKGQSGLSNQSTLLGNFNSFSAIGFIIGPVVGGHMAELKGGFSLVACTAGFVFLFNAGLVWCMAAAERSTSSQCHESNSAPDLRISETALSIEKVGSEELNLNISKVLCSFKDFNWSELWDLLLMRFFAGFSMIIFRTNFTMVLKLKFDASPSTIGYMTSFSGIIAALSGFCIGSLTKRYKNDNARLLLHASVFQVAALACLTVAPSLSLLLLALVPLNLVTSVSRVSATSLTVGVACGSSATGETDLETKDRRNSPASVGGVIGLGQSVMALARMSAPLVAGVAQEVAGVDAPAYISVLSALLAVAVMAVSGRGLRSSAKSGRIFLQEKKED